MKVCIIGTGYVGLVTGTCLAEMGNEVICVDHDPQKIQKLRRGEIPIYEPGLEELVLSNTREKRLSFTTNLSDAVQRSLLCFIAVGTPQGEDGSADLRFVFQAAREIASAMDGYRVIVNKSTVPVGSADKVNALIGGITPHPFDVVSNPEFLKQGAAVEDFLKPDRVVIGAESDTAREIMQELYAPFLRTGNPVILMNIRSAEMTKYVANAFLATKISFINEMSHLCEKVDADVAMVRTGICSDSRIGPQFLFPGLGYGGSCFPKDVKALINTAQEHDFTPHILKSVDAMNRQQRLYFLDKIRAYYASLLQGKIFAMWGLAFKPQTDDTREAPSISLLSALLSEGVRVKAYDPKAMENTRLQFGDQVEFCENAYDALYNADALLLVTEWNEFRRPDFERMKHLMRQPVIFDGRNQYPPDRMEALGFDYLCMGRASKLRKDQISEKLVKELERV